MKVQIEWVYGKTKGEEVTFRSEELEASKAILIAEDLLKTGRSKKVVFIDQFESLWTVKEMKAYLKEVETEPHNMIVYFDGGFDRATETAGLGCVIYPDYYLVNRNANKEADQLATQALKGIEITATSEVMPR